MSAQIQFRRGLAAEWTAANPIMADGELGLETDSRLYKIGDGVTHWNDLPYGSLELSSNVLIFSEQADHPAAPASGLKIYAKSLGGRMLPRIIGPAGIPTPLQPSFFQNFIAMISTGTSTSLYMLGCGATSVGTVSHPAATENYGYMANFISAATALATCGTGTSATIFMRGATPGMANGFFFSARIAYPDLSYDMTGAGTGTRTFVGMTSGTMAASVGADDPAGNHAGFMRRHHELLQDANWQFITKDNVVLNTIDTGLPFLPGKTYDVYVFCRPCGDEIFWRIDNITDGLAAEGSATLNLPLATTSLRGGFQLQTIDAVARNIRGQRIYIESDR
jgi:hypothetical protein